MKSWTAEKEINAPIDFVFSYLGNDEEKMKRVMPNVVSNITVKETPDKIGSIHRQKYREGKRIEEYDVIVVDYVDKSQYKKNHIRFTLADSFGVEAIYELKKIDTEKTKIRYTAKNNPLKWYFKMMMIFFNSNKACVEFVNRLKKVVEEEYQS